MLTAIGQQSPHIAQGVDVGKGLDLEQGAGDQGLMFGYATDETDVLMPMPITLAHRLVKRQAEVRKKGKLTWLRPDAKSQVTVRYIDGKPAGIDTVVLSTQHAPGVKHKTLKEAVIEEIVKPVLPKKWLDKNTKYLINPTGAFEIGGPVGRRPDRPQDHCRYLWRHGSSRRRCVLRQAIRPRSIARRRTPAAMSPRTLSPPGWRRCEIQIAYAIGVAKPVSVHVDTFGTGAIRMRASPPLCRRCSTCARKVCGFSMRMGQVSICRLRIRLWCRIIFARPLRGGTLVAHGDGTQTRDYIYVDDVVKAMAVAATAPSINGLVINVGSGVETSIKDLIKLVIDVTRSKANLVNNAQTSGGVSRMKADLNLRKEN